jgi:hypothetical protein
VAWPARLLGRVLYWGARYGGGGWVAAFWTGLKHSIDGELDDEKDSCEVWPKYHQDLTFVFVEDRKLIQDDSFLCPDNSALEMLRLIV